MKKFFRIVADTKLYCDEKGILLKDEEGNVEEVPETDTETQEVEVEDEGVEEVEKMLKEAADQVTSKAKKSVEKMGSDAIKAVESMFESFAKSAKKHTKEIETVEEKSSIDVEAIEKGLKDLSDGQRGKFSFTISSRKDLDMIAKSTSTGDLTGDVIEGDRVTEITRDPVRSVFVESIADVTPITADHLSYVEATNETGAPATTAELAAAPEKDFEFTEFKAPLKKIMVSNKHSVEILKDAPQLVSAIKGWLNEDVNIVTDDQLLNGDGTGSNLSGVFTVASVLDAAAVGTKSVADANLYDVIRVALTKVAVSGKGKFIANYVLLNPEDADALDLTKDSQGQYVLPPFRSADGTTIKGARVIENVGVPAGEFLVGDFRKLHVGVKGGVEVEMTNSDGTDFGKDILTVKLRRRIASYVRANDNGAFWTGTIADVITALTD